MDQLPIGDYVTEIMHSDRCAYEIMARTAKTLTLRRLKATLLNGPSSGAPDALRFSPGGFVGHTSGTQRYAYATQSDRPTVKAHWSQKRGCFKLGGNRIAAGASEHYDYNF